MAKLKHIKGIDNIPDLGQAFSYESGRLNMIL